MRRLLHPKFLNGVYFSNTCAKYSAGSDVTAAMSEISGAADASEVSAQGVFLEHLCKVTRCKRVTATMSENSVRRLPRPKFLQGAYFSNTRAKYITASA